MQKELKRGLNLALMLRDYHSDFPPNGLSIFIMIASNEGLSSTEIVEKLDLPKATVSRNLRMLGDRLSPDKEGMNLVRLEHDKRDYRVRRGYLTERGQDFLQKLTDCLK